MRIGFDAGGQSADIETPVVGTPFRLHHDSTRAPGYTDGARLKIPLIGSTIPNELKRVRLKIEVAGQIIERSFQPETDLVFEFEWDGKDAYGRNMAGTQVVDYHIGYVYNAHYQKPSSQSGTRASFSQPGVRATANQTRKEITIWRDYKGRNYGKTVSRPDAKVTGLGGWALDIHHDLDPDTGVVRYGDGTRRVLPPEQLDKSKSEGIQTAVGVPPDGQFINATGCDVGPDGSVYVTTSERISRVLPDGSVQTLFGTDETQVPVADENLGVYDIRDVAVDSGGSVYFTTGDLPGLFVIGQQGTVGSLKIQGSLPDRSGDRRNGNRLKPRAIAVGPNDGLYVGRTDGSHGVIHRIDTDRNIEIVAGTGEFSNGFSDYQSGKEPFDATDAVLSNPSGLSVDDTGRLYVLDSGYDVVFRIDPDGTIRAVAGNGTVNYKGDGSDALKTGFVNLATGDVAVDGQGGYYISSNVGHVVYHIDQTGTVTTAAGNGTDGYSGNGGPATQASFTRPVGLASDENGGVYVVQQKPDTLRHVTSGGTVEYVMGQSEAMQNVLGNYDSTAGDGGPATRAGIDPWDVTTGPNGELYVVSRADSMVRKVDASGTITTLAGTGDQGYSGDGGMGDQAQLTLPEGVAADANGNVYIADTGNLALRKVRPDGTITTVVRDPDQQWGGDTTLDDIRPIAVTVDADGHVYMASPGRVARVEQDGTVTTLIGGGRTPIADGVQTDDVRETAFIDLVHDGNNGLYLLASQNRIFHAEFGGRIRLIGGQTNVNDVQTPRSWVDGVKMYNTKGIAVGPDGSVYVSDTAEHRIYRVTKDASVGVTLGGQSWPKTKVYMDDPRGLAVDAAGDLYIADNTNYCVRRIRQERAKSGVETIVPATDGKQVFEFSFGGRHHRTYHGLTGDTIYDSPLHGFEISSDLSNGIH